MAEYHPFLLSVVSILLNLIELYMHIPYAYNYPYFPNSTFLFFLTYFSKIITKIYKHTPKRSKIALFAETICLFKRFNKFNQFYSFYNKTCDQKVSFNNIIALKKRTQRFSFCIWYPQANSNRCLHRERVLS